MTCRNSRIALVVFCLPILLGADTITLNNAVANPNGQAQTLEEDGFYTCTDTFDEIDATALNTATKQLSTIKATTGKDNQGNLTWTGTLNLVAGNYTAVGALHFKDNQGNPDVVLSNPKVVKVR